MRDYISQAGAIARDEGIDALAGSVLGVLAGKLELTRRYRLCRQRWHRFRRGDAVADPYRLISIRPQSVDYLVSPRFKNDLPTDMTHVVGGDWDQSVSDTKLEFNNIYEGLLTSRQLIPFENYGLYSAIEDHLRRGVPWHETEFYEWLLTTDALPTHSFYAREKTREWRFNQLDQLATSMREEGYKTQQECLEEATVLSRDEHAGGAPRADYHPPEHHEVMIDIGRDGRLIFEEGRHRFSVAKALDLERIPVRVLVRHSEWQKMRTEVARATTLSEISDRTTQYLSHPDMSDVAKFDE